MGLPEIPDYWGRLLTEAAQAVREEAVEARAASHGVERQMSAADRIAEGWDELDVVSKGWNVTSVPLLPGEGGRKRKRMR